MAKRRFDPNSLAGLLDDIRTTGGLLCVDGDQRITYWSPSAQGMLGYGPEEVLGLACYEVLAAQDPQNLRFCRANCPVIVNARRGRPSPDYDIVALAKDGSTLWVNVSIVLLRPESNASRLVLHIFKNVTEQRRLEAFARSAVEGLQSSATESDGPVNGSPALSRRERQALSLVALGMDNAGIAQAMGVSALTARNHVARALQKLGAHNRLQAVMLASRWHLI